MSRGLGDVYKRQSNKVLMLQNAIYSVISPEGCATILWRDPKKTLEASKAMKLSSRDLLNLEIIDEIIPEPIGGAHRDRDLILDNVRLSLDKNLNFFLSMEKDEILNHRKNKFLSIGRKKGFTTQIGLNENLTMKESKFDKIVSKFKSDIKLTYISIGILIFIFSLFFIL